MSADVSTACEDIVLRPGQHPGYHDDRPAGSEVRGPRYPERLHDILSRCQTDDEVDSELRDDYEVHRRSAQVNLNEYLDVLRRVHAEERSKSIHEIFDSQHKTPSTIVAVEMGQDLGSNAPSRTREQWRLKVLHDDLSRDLLAMQETLELLSARKPRKAKESSSRWDLFIPRFWFCVGLLNPFLWAMCLYKGAYGLIMHGDATCFLEVRSWPRPRRIESYQQRVNNLYRLLHKGQVGERNRRDLVQCALDW